MKDQLLARVEALRKDRRAVILAHNSVNGAGRLQPYFAFVRDKANFTESVNVIFDGEGLEVSVR